DGFDLYLVDAAGGTPRRLTVLAGDERSPAWTPDGRIVFSHRAIDQWDLSVINVDGMPDTAPPIVHALTRTRDDERYPSVSPDGTLVAYTSTQQDARGRDDVWVRRIGGIAAPFVGHDGDLEAAQDDPAAPMRVTVSSARESHPTWSPDGRRLAYASRHD